MCLEINFNDYTTQHPLNLSFFLGSYLCIEFTRHLLYMMTFYVSFVFFFLMIFIVLHLTFTL